MPGRVVPIVDAVDAPDTALPGASVPSGSRTAAYPSHGTAHHGQDAGNAPRPGPIPAPGWYGPGEVSLVVATALAGRWCTVALLDHWAGGRALGRLWQVASVHPEGAGLVVVMADGACLTLAGLSGAQLQRTPGAVTLAIPSASSASLVHDGEALPGSFESRDGRVVRFATDHPARWAHGPQVRGGGIRGWAGRAVGQRVRSGRGHWVRIVAVL